MKKTPTLPIIVLIALFTVACSSDEEVAAKSCAEMTRFECMESVDCTLELSTTPDVYTCLTAQGCGAGVSQNDLQGTIEGHVNCGEIDGCLSSDGACYCECSGYGMTLVEDGPETPECDCACDGGEPPACVSFVMQ